MANGTCLSCGAEVASGVRTCPQCGRDPLAIDGRKLMKAMGHAYWVLFKLLLSLGITAGAVYVVMAMLHDLTH